MIVKLTVITTTDSAKKICKNPMTNSKSVTFQRMQNTDLIISTCNEAVLKIVLRLNILHDTFPRITNISQRGGKW